MNSPTANFFVSFKLTKYADDTHEWIQIYESGKASYCKQIPDGLVGAVKVLKPNAKFNAQSNSSIRMSHNYHSVMGVWKPFDCKARHRVAIIIPYRDRLNKYLRGVMGR